jgi:hypothetical protein
MGFASVMALIDVLAGAVSSVMIAPMVTRGETRAFLNSVTCTGILRALDCAVAWDDVAVCAVHTFWFSRFTG